MECKHKVHELVCANQFEWWIDVDLTTTTIDVSEWQACCLAACTNGIYKVRTGCLIHVSGCGWTNNWILDIGIRKHLVCLSFDGNCAHDLRWLTLFESFSVLSAFDVVVVIGRNRKSIVNTATAWLIDLKTSKRTLVSPIIPSPLTGRYRK